MPTSAFFKFNDFVEQRDKKVHDLHADTLKVYLSNTTPVATMTIKSELAEIAAGFGYTAGGVDVQNTVTETGGVATVNAVDVVITAAGGSIAVFRYAVLYNDTPTSPLKAVDRLAGTTAARSRSRILEFITIRLGLRTSCSTPPNGASGHETDSPHAACAGLDAPPGRGVSHGRHRPRVRRADHQSDDDEQHVRHRAGRHARRRQLHGGQAVSAVPDLADQHNAAPVRASIRVLHGSTPFDDSAQVIVTQGANQPDGRRGFTSGRPWRAKRSRSSSRRPTGRLPSTVTSRRCSR